MYFMLLEHFHLLESFLGVNSLIKYFEIRDVMTVKTSRARFPLSEKL